MARLPVVGSDANAWGTVLNAYLSVAHNSDGSIKNLFVNVKDPAYGAVGDGVTDDTTAIQAAINAAAAAAGGGIVFFPSLCAISSTLSITSNNVRLLGVGRGSGVTALASFPASPMIQYQAPVTGFRFGANVSNMLIQNINGASGVTGLQLDSTYWAVVSYVDFEDVFATSLYLNGSGSYFGAYTQVDHCHFGPKPGGASSGGIGLLTSNHEFSVIRDSTFNWFSTAGGYGIKLQNGSNLIEGCTFDECDTGIWNWFQSHNVIQGNQFDRGVTQFIYLNGCKNTKVAGNSFQTFVGTGSKAMINADNGANASNIITSNTAKSGTTWTSFVVESGGAGTPGNIYANNDIASLAITRVSGIFRSNNGYNPIGQVTAPAFPATTVAATNSTGFDVTAYIANGTSAITVVQVAGVSASYVTTGYQIAANGWGSVRIPAGGSVKFTYGGGAPTWTWFGE